MHQGTSSRQFKVVTRKQRFKEVADSMIRMGIGSRRSPSDTAAVPAADLATPRNHAENDVIDATLRVSNELAVSPTDSKADAVSVDEELPSDLPVQAAKDVRLARTAYSEGEARMKEAAGHIAAAVQKGATQDQIGKVLGKSQSWVSQMMKWHAQGCPETPFGPQSKRWREANKRPGNQAPNNLTAPDESIKRAEPALVVVSPESSPIVVEEQTHAEQNPSGPDAPETPITAAEDLAEWVTGPLPPTRLDCPKDDGMATPVFLIRLHPEDQRLADELISRLLAMSDRVRRYVLAQVCPTCGKLNAK